MKLEFHGSKVAPDAGSLAYPELDEASSSTILHRPLTPMVLVTAVLACLAWALLSPTANATDTNLTWTATDVNLMWNGYVSDFYNTDGAGYYVFNPQAGDAAITGFWEEAEEIEMAEDGYNWATRENNRFGNGADIAGKINTICIGFTNHNGVFWSADAYDDDKNWAEIAFARACQITGNNKWLGVATNNFNYVWKYGQVKGVTNGSWGLTQITNTERMYANVNFTFVIAGYLLYDITGNSTYKSEADAVFNWSKTNLYVYNHEPAKNGSTNVCSMIYNYNDSEFGKDIQNRDCMYNYGTAIQAAYFEHDTNMAVTVANWMIYNVDADPAGDGVPYAGTCDGYNVLPDYGAGTDNGANDCGYDGIGLRGFGVALRNGLLTNPDALPFAEANLQSAWNHRGPDNVEWCGWTTSPSGTKYSWGDSSAMAGMFDVPAEDVSESTPVLSIKYSGDEAILFWPSDSTGFVLQQSGGLTAANWVDATNLVNVVGNENQAIISPASGNVFYRLKSQSP
ncbi:MAG: hypothetical protein ACREFR_19250 [Limisphaerales bacterium]